MRGEKKKLIVLTYGFHPPEVFAEEIGKRVEKSGLEGIVALKFKPSCIPDNIHELPTIKVWELNELGITEQGDFLRKKFKRVDLHIDLHDSPSKRYGKVLQYELSFPGCNVNLGKMLKNFAELQGNKGRKVKVDAVGLYKGDFYNSVVIDFGLCYPQIEKKELESMLNDAFNFTTEFIDYVKTNFLYWK